MLAQVYIAPLTTVGNLPFRRICKDLGADITCGEMAITTSILQGQAMECSLLKRHPCEDVFGVQIAGAFPDTVARTCELIDDHVSASIAPSGSAGLAYTSNPVHRYVQMQVDFVDLNMGCPLDHVCRRGMGAGLMRRVGRIKVCTRQPRAHAATVRCVRVLSTASPHARHRRSRATPMPAVRQGIVREATKVLGCEFTMKMRVGQSWKAPVAPSFITAAREVGGVSAIGVR